MLFFVASACYFIQVLTTYYLLLTTYFVASACYFVQVPPAHLALTIPTWYVPTWYLPT